MSKKIEPVNVTPDAADVSDTKRVVIRLDAAIQSDALKLSELSQEENLTQLTDFLADNSHVEHDRVFDHLSPRDIREREKVGIRGEFPPLKSLANYWRLDFSSVDDPEPLRAQLQDMPGIEVAYHEPPVMPASPAAPSVVGNTYQASQLVLDAAPLGIDARSAWDKTNGMGQGVKVVDVEGGWIEGHEDLPVFELLEGTNGIDDGYSDGNHGAAALGIVGALNNEFGTIGIAPRLEVLDVASHYDGDTDLHVGKAIDSAALTLDPGDIIYLEVQRPIDGIAYPAEVVSSDLQAIRSASNQGIIVIEAAANNYPALNLDDWRDPLGEHSLAPDADPDLSSGAILVGACRSDVTTDPLGFDGHNRYYRSSHGSRVDCYAWGEDVYSAGYGSLSGFSGSTNSYTSNFGETSAATAIIAGAAAVVQSWYMTWCGRPLSPAQMRAILSNEATGTRQTNQSGDPIGVMPNLNAIMTCRRRLMQILACIVSRASRGTALQMREFEPFKMERPNAGRAQRHG